MFKSTTEMENAAAERSVRQVLRGLTKALREGSILPARGRIRRAEELALSAPHLPRRLMCELLVTAAECAHALGTADKARQLLTAARARQHGEMDLAGQIRRLEARLLLDEANYAAARKEVSYADRFVLSGGNEETNGRYLDSGAGVRVASELLLAEIAAADGDWAAAGEYVGCAQYRAGREGYVLTPDEAENLEIWSAVMQYAEGTAAPSRATPLRDLARRWLESAAVVVAAAEASATDRNSPIEATTMAGAPARERLAALLNRTMEGIVGINPSERVRWQKLGRGLADHAVRPVVQPKIVAASDYSQVELAQPAGDAAQTKTEPPPGHMPVTANDWVEVFNRVTDRLAGQIVELTRSSNQADVEQRAEGAAGSKALYSGQFAHFDLVQSLLSNAQNNRVTGYFEIRWNPAAVESAIAAGRLSRFARHGQGYLFLRDGLIIDADLRREGGGGNEPPAVTDADLDEVMEMLLQIGVNAGLDAPSEGRAAFYGDEAAAARPVRLSPATDGMTQAGLMFYLPEIDARLANFYSEESAA